MFKTTLLSRSSRLLAAVIVLALTSFLWTSCNQKPENSALEPSSGQPVLSKDNPDIQKVMKIQDRHTRALMKIQDVIGTATGLTEDGRPAILVLTKTDIKASALAQGKASPIPDILENIPVEILVTGEIVHFKDTPSLEKTTAVSHTAKQTPPIQLGTSGGWRYDLANGYCCSGTLGALITDGTDKYILSNWHVLYSDIVSGGNSRVAQAGDPVIQPGMVDISCNAANAQDVATLLDPSIGGSLYNYTAANVDAGIAKVISGMVDPNGSILEIGTISSKTVAASLRQAVKKSGRTTGLTTSSVSGLNATISVSYENECAGATAFTKTYTGQIVIKNRKSSFLASGDSGSLMVENVSTNPRAVGLLYAGSSTTAIANPINDVLNFYSSKLGKTVTMVGK
ncbi:MAG: hypothetical protein ACM3MI_04610 [Clostridiales bacterium]